MIFGMVTTRGSTAFTPYALDSFFLSTALGTADQFYLIDNDGSSDPAWCVAHSAIQVLRNEVPLSFAANVNQILRRAAELKEDLVFLNNDLIFTKGWLDPLRAVTAPALLSPLSNVEVRSKSERVEFTNVVTLEQYLTHPGEVERMAAKIQQAPSGFLKVVSLPFFCIKIPYSVYSKVGLLDERFGRGGAEDNDYCLRAILHGFDACYASNSWVLHFNGRSTWGVESTDESAARCALFTERFKAKWGPSLTNLAVGRSFEILQEPELEKLATAGRYQELIQLLARHDGIICEEALACKTQ